MSLDPTIVAAVISVAATFLGWLYKQIKDSKEKNKTKPPIKHILTDYEEINYLSLPLKTEIERLQKSNSECYLSLNKYEVRINKIMEDTNTRLDFLRNENLAFEEKEYQLKKEILKLKNTISELTNP